VYALFLNNVLKAIASVLIFIVGFILIKEFVLQSAETYGFVIKSNPFLMYGVFFASESFLGLLPPDLFIIWITGLPPFIPKLALLAALSFSGGVVSYQIGRAFSQTQFIRKMHVRYFRKYNRHIDQWGGLIILIAAMTPLPFSPISMVSGSLQFPFKNYLMFASVRFVRFAIYGWIFWHIS
jgi:membrane protein YqaA with SNARE-associated domain